MTLSERYELSCYEELTCLKEGKNVWLVQHNETGQICVKKKMQLYNSAVYRRLQKQKIQNIPEIYLCIEDAQELIVIEEYIHGTSLEQKIERNGKLNEAEAINYMLQLCDIVEVLHQEKPPIIHRDIKPSNIMVSSDGIVKLIDFNAAKEYKDNQHEDTRLMGTRGFAAPEQYGFGQSDVRTDIYAMGTTLQYLLTGTLTDSTNNRGTTAAAKPNADCGKMTPVIERCIELSKEKRYPSVSTLREEIIRQGCDDSAAVMEAQQKKEEMPKKHLYSRREKLPVGFRTGTLWKMAAAIFGYVCIFLYALGAASYANKGETPSGTVIFINWAGLMAMMLGAVSFFGNYRNIRYRFPLMKKGKIVHWIMTALYLALYCILLMLIIISLEDLVS